MKNKKMGKVLILLFSLLFIIILFYHWSSLSTCKNKNTEGFNSIQPSDTDNVNNSTIIPLDLKNTTLSQYENKWGNSRLINNQFSSQYGYLFYEDGTMIKWNNLPMRIKNNYFSISFWLYLNTLTDNRWQDIFRVQSEKLATDRAPGVWIWPAPPPWSSASLHIRNKLTNISNNSYYEIFNHWNSGEHDKTGMTDERNINWQTYWGKEIKNNAIKLKVPMHCTIVFEDRKYRLYIDGNLQNEYEHEHDIAIVGDDATITVCGEMANEWTYFIKDFKIWPLPLQASDVKTKYEEVKNNSDLEGAVKLATEKQYNATGYKSFKGFDSYGDDIYSYGATLEQCKQTCNDDINCKGFAFKPQHKLCFTKNKDMFPKNELTHLADTDTYVKISQFPSNSYSYLRNRDSGGHDIPGAAHGNSTVEKCRKICDDNNNCSGFAFHVPYNTCYPKDGTMFPNGQMNYHPEVDLHVKNSHMKS